MNLKTLDQSGLQYLWGKIKSAFVAQENGKGLSSNDYTTADKNKLEGLSNYTLPTASASTKGGIKVGSGLSIDGNGVLSATGGSGGASLPSVTSDDNGKVLKVSSGAWNKGYQSWNDLTDRPFYETVTVPGYNYEIDLSGNYVSGYFNIGEDIPCRFYRVGDPLTASQLLGAVGAVDNGEEIETHVIESSYIDEIEDNGDTVGLFVAGDMPYCLVINNANTTINYTGSVFGCSGTFAAAGTYLFWIDLSSLFGEGAAAYNPSLVKADEAVIAQLPDKFYKAPLVVTADLDIQQLSVSNVSATFAEIEAAITAERPVTLWLQFNDGYHDVNVPLMPSMGVEGMQVDFAVTAPYIFGGSKNVYTVYVSINASNTVSATFYLHSTTNA